MNELEKIVERLARRLADPHVVIPPDSDGPNQAAVALVLRENLGLAEMLIIKRAVRSGDHWSGNLALPGGRWESHDDSLLETAIRETDEEVGINLRIGGKILGPLNSITTRNPAIPIVRVVPFAAIAPPVYHITNASSEAENLVLSEEVETAFWSPVQTLISGGRSESFSMVYKGEHREWPAYPTAHGVIWGMTEVMISEFLSLIT